MESCETHRRHDSLQLGHGKQFVAGFIRLTEGDLSPALKSYCSATWRPVQHSQKKKRLSLNWTAGKAVGQS